MELEISQECKQPLSSLNSSQTVLATSSDPSQQVYLSVKHSVKHWGNSQNRHKVAKDKA